MVEHPTSAEPRQCTCELHCVLHVYADDMLAMLYQYASECSECEGTGEVVVSSVQRDVDSWDETMGPCSACAHIRELIKRVDPCGDLLTRAQPPKREAPQEIEDDIPF